MLEHDLRIDFVRQRLGGRGPGNRIGVSAAIAPAADSGVRARIFDRELDRRQQRILAVLLRDHLVDAGAAIDVRAGGLLRRGAGEGGRGARVIAAARSGRRHRRGRIETADDRQLVLPRRQRLMNEAKPDVAAFRRRDVRTAIGPIGGRPAVRRKDRREARLRAWPPSSPRASAPESSNRATAAPA